MNPLTINLISREDLMEMDIEGFIHYTAQVEGMLKFAYKRKNFKTFIVNIMCGGDDDIMVNDIPMKGKKNIFNNVTKQFMDDLKFDMLY